MPADEYIPEHMTFGPILSVSRSPAFASDFKLDSEEDLPVACKLFSQRQLIL